MIHLQASAAVVTLVLSSASGQPCGYELVRDWTIPGVVVGDSLTALPNGGVLLDYPNSNGPNEEHVYYRWDGTSWSVGATHPNSTSSAAYAVDHSGGVVYRFGGLVAGEPSNALWVLNNEEWIQLSVGNPKPEPRWSAGMAFDTCRDVLTMHGGHDGSNWLRDTWEWHAAVGWSLVSEVGPIAGSEQALEFDRTRCATVLLAPGSSTSETWIWVWPTWTPVYTDGPSSTSQNLPMYFDSSIEQVCAIDIDARTWGWTGTHWEEVTPAPEYGFLGFDAAYDEQRSTAVAFGGITVSEMSSGSWTQMYKLVAGQSSFAQHVTRETATTAPFALANLGAVVQKGEQGWDVVGLHPQGMSAFAFDRSRSVLVGVGTESVWRYAGGEWIAEGSMADGPGSRTEVAAVYDAVAQAVLVVGGTPDGEPSPRDTWSWDGVAWELLDLGPAEGGGAGRYLLTDWDSGATIAVFRTASGAESGVYEWNGEGWSVLDPELPPFSKASVAWDWTRDSVIATVSSNNEQWLWTEPCGWQLATNPIASQGDYYAADYDFSSDAMILGRAGVAGVRDPDCDDNECCWSITEHPAGLTVEIGDAAAFSVATSRVGDLTYEWRRDGDPLADDGRIVGSQSILLTINPVEFADSGAYTVDVSTSCRSEESLPAVLIVNCPVDINGDGFVNTTDVIEFLTLWVAEDDRADFNSDGHVDSRDFMVFLNAWVAGC